jgi:hypothetical protein
VELKSKKLKPKSKKPKPLGVNMPYKPKIESRWSQLSIGQSTLSPVYSNMHGKVIYIMSAKLIKHVTVIFPKSLLTTSNYPHSNVSPSIEVEVKEKVIHKKKVKPIEESGMYDKEYNTTSEYRRFKNLEVVKEDTKEDTKEDVKEDAKEGVKEDTKEHDIDENNKEDTKQEDDKAEDTKAEDSKQEGEGEFETPRKETEEDKDNIEEEESDEEYNGEG